MPPEAPNPLDRLRARALAVTPPASILLAEGGDPRVVLAAERATALGLCRASVVGSREAVESAATAAGAVLTVPVLDPAADPELPLMTEYLAGRLSARGLDPALAPDLARDPLQYAALRVARGQADGAVMGTLPPTADPLGAALGAIGPRPGLEVVSSC